MGWSASTLATLSLTLASRLQRPAWAAGIIGLRLAHPRNARVEPCAWPAFRVQRPGPEFKRIRMSSEKASLEPRHTGHEVLARHTATQGPMQSAEDRRELREASCSEPAHVGLAELGALIVMNPPFLVQSSVSVWHGHGCLQAAHQMQTCPQSVPAGSRVATWDSPTLGVVDLGSV